MDFQEICNWIVLISAVLIALKNIVGWIGKTFGLFKKRQDRALVQEIKQEILAEINPTLKEIKELLDKQGQSIDVLQQGTKDVLRQKIMDIYYAHRHERKYTLHEKEKLTELYKDYKKEGGNSYIDKYYNRMKDWEIDFSDDEDDDRE